MQLNGSYPSRTEYCHTKGGINMKQEEKELLLKDLCARLPYGVKIEGYELPCIILNSDWLHFMYTHQEFALRKPYLRPMSSMTEEEDREYIKVIAKSQDCSFENSESATTMVNDWLLSKGFDVRGLIFKGLAIEAPEGIYK